MSGVTLKDTKYKDKHSESSKVCTRDTNLRNGSGMIKEKTQGKRKRRAKTDFLRQGNIVVAPKKSILAFIFLLYCIYCTFKLLLDQIKFN